jgi:hypothetical protein
MSGIENEEDITWEEVRSWLEQGAWTVLCLTPFLYWINGPAVSSDQLFFRWLLIIVAATTALVLTIRRFKSKKD